MPAGSIDEARERVWRENGGAIVRSRSELTTQALVLDRRLAERNIRYVAVG